MEYILVIEFESTGEVSCKIKVFPDIIHTDFLPMARVQAEKNVKFTFISHHELELDFYLFVNKVLRICVIKNQ